MVGAFYLRAAMLEFHPSVSLIRDRVHRQFSGEGTGHGWYHIERVTRTSLDIAREEGADLNITALGAWLHDVADWKFHNGDLGAGPRIAREWMIEAGCPEGMHDVVCEIVSRVSFKGAGVQDEMPMLEGRCVQDADRLDAIGAIGIARTFAYGGHKGQPLFDPELLPEQHMSFEAYKDGKTSTVNHFYEKLLLLKDRMHTDAGRRLAQERHDFMLHFLDQFYTEWGHEVKTHAQEL